jgi:hypothetical protein
MGHGLFDGSRTAIEVGACIPLDHSGDVLLCQATPAAKLSIEVPDSVHNQWARPDCQGTGARRRAGLRTFTGMYWKEHGDFVLLPAGGRVAAHNRIGHACGACHCGDVVDAHYVGAAGDAERDRCGVALQQFMWRRVHR